MNNGSGHAKPLIIVIEKKERFVMKKLRKLLKKIWKTAQTKTTAIATLPEQILNLSVLL